MQQQMQQQNSGDAYLGVGGGGSTLTYPDVSQILPWNLPQHVHAFNPLHYSTRDHDPFLLPPPGPQSYGGFFNRRQFGYESDHHLRLISEVVHPSSAPFGLHAELQKMTAQEIMDAKALAASKSHSEAERRRRERINNHLARLRSLLPSTTKTDKASLLAEVIQHVKELKRQTSLIAETSPVPTEIDELTVDHASDEEGRLVIKASICCEDRSDLLPDLIKTLKELRLKTLKAEITTLGGRVKNVLFITGEDELNDGGENGDGEQLQQYSISSIQEALKAVMEKSNGDESGSGGINYYKVITCVMTEFCKHQSGFGCHDLVAFNPLSFRFVKREYCKVILEPYREKTNRWSEVGENSNYVATKFLCGQNIPHMHVMWRKCRGKKQYMDLFREERKPYNKT